jgi:hypothetical protein
LPQNVGEPSNMNSNFERTSDQKIVAKVLVTCELTIFGLGSHSATGEEWADDANAGTSAEAAREKPGWPPSPEFLDLCD